MESRPRTTDGVGGRGPAPGRVLLALAVLLTTACASRAASPFDQTAGGQASLSVYLENRGFNDVRVYAIIPSGARPMGVVGGNTIERASLPWRQSALISFRIEVLAGRTYMTHALSADPGDRLELIIPSDPANAVLRPRS